MPRPPAMHERVERDGELLAVVVYAGFCEPGLRFFTPNELSQQLAHMRHPAGRVVPPHVHNPVPRSVTQTQETLFVRSGRVRVDLYDLRRRPAAVIELEAGDAILFVAGGHGLTVLEDADILEVKQGPYAGHEDKTVFTPSGEGE